MLWLIAGRFQVQLCGLLVCFGNLTMVTTSDFNWPQCEVSIQHRHTLVDMGQNNFGCIRKMFGEGKGV
jgi:hypothetical protein